VSTQGKANPTKKETFLGGDSFLDMKRRKLRTSAGVKEDEEKPALTQTTAYGKGLGLEGPVFRRKIHSKGAVERIRRGDKRWKLRVEKASVRHALSAAKLSSLSGGEHLDGNLLWDEGHSGGSPLQWEGPSGPTTKTSKASK